MPALVHSFLLGILSLATAGCVALSCAALLSVACAGVFSGALCRLPFVLVLDGTDWLSGAITFFIFAPVLLGLILGALLLSWAWYAFGRLPAGSPLSLRAPTIGIYASFASAGGFLVAGLIFLVRLFGG